MNSLLVHTLQYPHRKRRGEIFGVSRGLILHPVLCLGLLFFLVGENLSSQHRGEAASPLENEPLQLHAAMLKQPRSVSVLDNDMGTKISLTQLGWKYHAGDSAHWSEHRYNDSLWARLPSTQETRFYPDVLNAGIGWFRLRIRIDSSLAGQRVGLKIGDLSPWQFYPIPMEIFLDNRCCFRQGQPSPLASGEWVSIGGQKIETLVLPTAGEYTVAVRASFHGVKHSVERYAWLQQGQIGQRIGFSLAMVSEASGAKYREQYFFRNVQYIIAATIPLCLAFLHGVLFAFYRNEKSNIYLSLFALSSGVMALVLLFGRGVGVSSLEMLTLSRWVFNPLCGVLMGSFILLSMFALKRENPHHVAKLVLVWTACSAIAFALVDSYGAWSSLVSASLVVSSLAGSVIIIHIIIQMWKKQNSVLIIALGIAINLGVMAVDNTYNTLGLVKSELLLMAVVFGFHIAPALSMSVFVAYQIAYSNRLLARQRDELDEAVKERTQELSEANREIQRQVDVLNEQSVLIELSNSQLQEQNHHLLALNNEKNELMGIAAHDLKNPLASVRLVADMLLRYEERIDLMSRRDYLQNIIGATERMMAIISNILEMNALEEGGITFHCIPVDIVPFVSTSVQEFQQKAKEKTITLHLVAPDSAFVIADVQALSHIFDNLISNAVKYSPHNKNVYVRLKSSAEAVRVEVQDEGPGISQEDMKKLFGKFARLSARPTGGEHSTGLGLSIVKKMVEAMNGKVWCESEVGKGATFIVELPAVTA